MLPDTLGEEHEALLQFLYLSPVGLVQASMAGDIAMLNPVSAQLLMPISPDSGLTNLFAAFESVAPELRHLCAAYAEPQGMICDGLRIQINAGVPGKTDPQVFAVSLLKLDAARLMAVINDISVQVKRDRQLKLNEAWFNSILTGITDYALVNLDVAGRIVDWNESIGRVTGFERAAIVGHSYAVFYPDGTSSAQSLLDHLHEADANGWSLEQGERCRADGHVFWASTMIAPLRDCKQLDPLGLLDTEASGSAAYCLVIRDISDRRDASENHRRSTFSDYLTGIANRRAFFDAGTLEFERLHRAPRPVSLIMFDADHFKKINDRYGHPAGDQVLVHLAKTLTAAFRQIDIVARIGGEEFAVLLPSTGMESAVIGAERLRALVEAQPVEVDGVQIHYTVSGGVASVDETVSGLDALIKLADQALYAAKRRGRNRVEVWKPAPTNADDC